MGYIGRIVRLHFPNCDRKKITKDVFRKEIAGAYDMGALDFIDEFVKKYKNQDLSKDELIGELEKISIEKYENTKKIFGLFRLPKFTVDSFVR